MIWVLAGIGLAIAVIIAACLALGILEELERDDQEPDA